MILIIIITGLFRVPGAKTSMDKWEHEFNIGLGTNLDFFSTKEEPADVASLLKKYLREVPDKPLFTKDLESKVL
jgi:hypothetical protein